MNAIATMPPLTDPAAQLACIAFWAGCFIVIVVWANRIR